MAASFLLKLEAVVGDPDLEVLGHLAPAQHRADRLADRRRAAQRLARPLDARLDAAQVLLGRLQQLLPLARPLGGQERVLADHQAFARIVGAGDLGHVTLVEQRRLQRPALGGQRLDRRGAQSGDPIQAGRAQRLLDARAGEQAAVAHHDHTLQVEPLADLVDLRGERRRIGGVAVEHLDRHRAAIRGAQQADHQLRAIAPVVSTVTVLREFAAASFQVGGGDVVEQQGAVLEVTAGQRRFDERLLARQPVERGVELAGGDTAEPQHLAQRMAGGGGIEHPRGGELGRRIEQAGDDQRQSEVTPPLWRTPRQQAVEVDPSGGAQGGEHVAMRQGAHDLDRLAGRQQPLAAQHGAQLLDALGWPGGEVGQRAFLGLAVLAVALAQQDGGGRASVGHHVDMHGPTGSGRVASGQGKFVGVTWPKL